MKAEELPIADLVERLNDWAPGVTAVRKDCLEAATALTSLSAEVARLKAERDTPEIADFTRAVPLEAEHQRARWGVDHDAGKSPFDWFWLIGYLAQKAADAAARGDMDKARHHTISTAATLANWHLALSGGDSRFQPGITPKPAEMTV